MKRKGIDVSGGGLAARIADFNSIAQGVGSKFKYHKPGSQNPRKGGLSRAECKRASYTGR